MSALFKIIRPPLNTRGEPKSSEWIDWHIEEPLPPEIFDQRVLTIQADGHELYALLAALKQICKS